jgi:hypothetical protein
MVLYDGSGGVISGLVGQIAGQSLAPDDLKLAFDQVCGGLWYYLLRTQVKLMRGQHWAARHDFNFVIVGNLLALLRIEAGAIDHWRGASAAVGIEEVISGERLAQLDDCIPGRGATAVHTAMHHAAILGQQTCTQITQQTGWDWPETLAEKILKMLKLTYDA